MTMRRRRLLGGSGLAFAATVLMACGSSPSSPSTPPAAATTVANLTGTWQSPSGNWTWELVQNGTAVTGTSQFNGGTAAFVATIGPYTGVGTIAGVFADNTFDFAERFDPISVPGCVNTSTGHVALSGTTLNGQYTETMVCGGQSLGTFSKAVTFNRK